MRRTSFILLMLIPLILSGCGEGTPSSNEKPSDTFSNVLPDPSNSVKNIQELADVCDYYAYYHIEKFHVQLDSSYTITNLKTEMNKLFWLCELVNGTMGMSTKQNGSTLNFEYTFYPNAVQSAGSENTYHIAQNITYATTDNPRSDTFNDFAVESVSDVLDVETTQQLWYALEHGYKPNFVGTEKAKYYYDAFKVILRKIVSDDMSEYEKVESIYDYIINTVVYDYDALKVPQIYTTDPDNFPDADGARYKGYYVDGFIDDGRVVCDGFAKSYVAMARMEGIEIYRVLGSNGDYSSRSAAGHAYTYVNVDDVWYTSCPTWATYGYGDFNYKALSHVYFLCPKSNLSSYASNFYLDLNINTVYPYWTTTKYDGTNALYLDSETDLNTYANYLKTNRIGASKSFEFAYDENVLSESTIKSTFDTVLTANTYYGKAITNAAYKMFVGVV